MERPQDIRRVGRAVVVLSRVACLHFYEKSANNTMSAHYSVLLQMDLWGPDTSVEAVPGADPSLGKAPHLAKRLSSNRNLLNAAVLVIKTKLSTDRACPEDASSRANVS